MTFITESILHLAFFSAASYSQIVILLWETSEVSAYFALKWQAHSMELKFSFAPSVWLCVWLLHTISFLLFQASNLCSFACMMLLLSELKNYLSKILSWAHCKAQQLGRQCLGANVLEDFLRRTAEIMLSFICKNTRLLNCSRGLILCSRFETVVSDATLLRNWRLFRPWNRICMKWPLYKQWNQCLFLSCLNAVYGSEHMCN